MAKKDKDHVSRMALVSLNRTKRRCDFPPFAPPILPSFHYLCSANVTPTYNPQAVILVSLVLKDLTFTSLVESGFFLSPMSQSGRDTIRQSVNK